MTSLTLYAKLETLSPELKSEANDFIDFLIEKNKKKNKESKVPKFGELKGKIKISSDFDAPIDDFKEYM
ncbi:type II toxin-antitoxin system VapB family antitoxin [Pedobacter glucosidilyticus]|uniref:type II toxin-antitoxin system VapB family antitoxin n=1 Tax=Pedobacter glucosidilyticus TaxID=1122941 RepID=UPI0026ECDDD4|nr:DUF2281 domain-containing protein [Pedobacter glucosidilyticus]